MWPIPASEIVAAVEGAPCAQGHPDPTRRIQSLTIDSRKVPFDSLFVAVSGAKFDGHDYVTQALAAGAALALVNRDWKGIQALAPQLKERCVGVDDTLSGMRRLARRFRTRLPCPVIGIGGSNGKTTTKELLAAMLCAGDRRISKTEKSENGFLGMALTLCQSSHREGSRIDALVLEIGIDESGAMRQHVALGTPDVVLLTALGPEHLAGLGTWDNAIDEELLLFRERPEAVRIYQAGDERLREAMSGDLAPRKQDWIVAEAGLPVPWGDTPQERRLLWKLAEDSSEGVRIEVTDPGTGRGEGLSLPLPGKHNAANAALAAATAISLGRSWREITEGISRFEAPAMRSAVERLPNGCILINDCYNASPGSMEAALSLLDAAEWRERPKLLVLADMLDLGVESKHWHLKLVPLLAGRKNTTLRLFGNEMLAVHEALRAGVPPQSQGVWEALAHAGPEKHPATLVNTIPFPWERGLVLVKGSRGMDLGRVVDEIRKRCRLDGH